MSDNEWQTLVNGGEHIINILDEPSYADAVEYCKENCPSWIPRMASKWEDSDFMETYGWIPRDDPSRIRNIHIDRISNALAHYGLSTDPKHWCMTTLRHSEIWVDRKGQECTPSLGFFSFLIDTRLSGTTMIWTAMHSPEYMIAQQRLDAIPPPLAFGSDLLFLQYYRWWTLDLGYHRADPSGGSPIPPPKFIIIRRIEEPDTIAALHSIKRRQSDTSVRQGARAWPGDYFDRDDDALYILMATRIGKVVLWFLVQHKYIFGAKSVGGIRVWSTDRHQDDTNLLFEIIDSPDS